MSPTGQTQPEAREQGSSCDAASKDQLLGAQSRAEMGKNGSGETEST